MVSAVNGRGLAISIFVCQAALVNASAQAKKEPRLSAYQGCYRVAVSAWRGNAGLDPSVTTPPSPIELTGEQVEGFTKTKRYWVKPAREAKNKAFPLSFWHLTPQGEVTITFTTGFEGLTMTLVPKGSSLIGTARASGDVNPDENFQIAGARADRMECNDRK